MIIINKENKQKVNTIVGSIGAFIGVFVFISYIPQIIANLKGNKSQPLQPLTATISCLIWVIYGLTKDPKKDYLLINYFSSEVDNKDTLFTKKEKIIIIVL